LKTQRFDFRGGVNVVGDKASMFPGYAESMGRGPGDRTQTGFVTVMDNVDLRSGQPRALRAPQYRADIVPPAGSVQLYSYRGKWYFSQLIRKYVSTFLGGHERVMFTQYGTKPQKIIDGAQATLGCIVPAAAPSVISQTQMIPSVSLVQALGGNIQANVTRSYRVGVETVDGILPACPAINIVAVVNYTQVTLTWRLIYKAIKYHVYAGNGSDEAEIAVLSGSQTSFIDSGSGGGGGTLASSFDLANPFTYFYTFLRSVQTVEDESGPSPLSASITAATGRSLVFDPVGDGYLTQDNAQTITSGFTLSNSASYIAPVVIASATYNVLQGLTAFTTVTPHGFTNGDIECFTGFSDLAWNNLTFPVIVDSSNTSLFYVKNMPIPTDSNLGNGLHKAQPARTEITLSSPLAIPLQDSTVPPTQLTAVYMAITDGTTVYPAAMYNATVIDSTHFWINLYTSNATPTAPSFQYVPNNGYILYRNLYRTGDAAGYSLVSQVPMNTLSYFDVKGYSALGDAPDSYYEDNGVTVIYAPPDLGMAELTEHYGMLFGINGNDVRWTPTGRPDAWPEDFVYSFANTPVALASYAGALIVMASDGIYRLDGNEPTQMSLNKTKAENGCIATHSVQATHAGLIYLSQRGLMLFNGEDARCLTDTRLPYQFFSGSSTLATAIPFWWIPTLQTYNYANLAYYDGILGSDAMPANVIGAQGVVASVDCIRSFYHEGKYYIYWSLTDPSYAANTALCVDLELSSAPITTLGMKAYSVWVDELEDAYCLFPFSTYTVPAGTLLNFDLFTQSQCTMAPLTTWDATSGLGVYSFATDPSTNIPFYVRTGQQSLGDPTERKRFDHIEVHADNFKVGTIAVRVWVDGHYVCDGMLVPAETPSKVRKLNLPRRMNTGYVIDLEMAGDINIRAIEFHFDAMRATS